MSNKESNDQGIYFEIKRMGVSARVACIDARTGVEVIAIAPASSSEAVLKQLGLNKLRYKLRKLGLSE